MPVDLTSAEGNAGIEVIFGASESNGVSLDVPFVMPTEQRYYWSPDWQAAERQTVAEINAGQSVEFSSEDPQDILRWLDD